VDDSAGISTSPLSPICTSLLALAAAASVSLTALATSFPASF